MRKQRRSAQRLCVQVNPVQPGPRVCPREVTRQRLYDCNKLLQCKIAVTHARLKRRSQSHSAEVTVVLGAKSNMLYTRL